MKKKIIDSLLALGFTITMILMVIYPSPSYNAAKNGLDIWFYNVLPSLLPFFIGAELLIGLGVVNFLGVLLKPIMYPLFKVPGSGSFAYAMSITSGYPMGTKITTQLRDLKICSKEEGQRLLAFCSTSGPLFIIGAVAVGMFNNPSLGVLLLISHYIGSITTGICFRWYGRSKQSLPSKSMTNNPFVALYQARKDDGRKFGILFGDAVRNSIQSLLSVGGFIVFFSVLTELLTIVRVFDFCSFILAPVFSAFNFSDTLIKGLLSGILEMTNGVNIISTSHDSFLIQGLFTSLVIGWGGFSIHAQAISFISKTDLKISFYFIAKVLHSIFAGIAFYLIMKSPILSSETLAKSVFYNHDTILFPQLSWASKFAVSFSLYFNITIFLIIFSLLFFILNKIKAKIIR